jgi:hypothetical protein
MSGHRLLVLVFASALSVALAAAYGVAMAGLLGWFDARTVSLATISAGAIALIAAVGYFALSEREIRRRFGPAR